MQAAIEAALRRALHAATADAEKSPTFQQGKAAGFVLGADGNAEAALLALGTLGVSPLFLLNRDSRDMYLLINKLRTLDIQGVRSLGMLQREMEDLTAKGAAVCVGIAAVPTPPAQFPSEEMVYDIAYHVLMADYQPSTSQEGDSIAMPEKRIFLDLAEEGSGGVLTERAGKAEWSTIRLGS